MTLPPLDIDAEPRTATETVRVAPDAACAAAVELARAAAVLDAGLGGSSQVGEHVTVEADADRIATHYFACIDRAYVGWRWAVTVVRAPRSKLVTVDEVVLLPGPDALRAPAWVPWSERLQAGDLGVGDVLPTADDDPRLEAGYFGYDPRDVVEDIDDVVVLDALVRELGLGRPRVLSELGRIEAADRWYDGDRGPESPIAKAAELPCSTCGFLVMMRGALSRMFGVCTNEYAPDDGRVVSYDHGCGAHSEALVVHEGPLAEAPPLAVMADELDADALDPEDPIDVTEPLQSDGPAFDALDPLESDEAPPAEIEPDLTELP